MRKTDSEPGLAASLRGLDAGDSRIFTLHFEWGRPMRTSLHRHKGWELVLIRSGELSAVVNDRVMRANEGEFIELPSESAHAIWCTAATTFDVLGQVGLGLWMIVPDSELGRREVPIFDREGPWRMDPPSGAAYTSPDEVARLRELSQQLLPAGRTGSGPRTQ